MTNIIEKDDRRFKALSFVWLLFCFYAAPFYADFADLDGLFLRVFIYGVFAAPVWGVFGLRYLFAEDVYPVSLKSLAAVSVLYLGWGLSIEGHYNDGDQARLIIAGGCVFFWVLAFPFSRASELIERKRLARAFISPKPQKPLSEQEKKDQLISQRIRELIRLKERNGLSDDLFKNNDATHLLVLLDMQRNKILPEDFFRKNDPAQIQEKVDKRFVTEILGLSNETSSDKVAEQMSADDFLRKTLSKESILRFTMIIEEEYGAKFSSIDERTRYAMRLTPSSVST